MGKVNTIYESNIMEEIGIVNTVYYPTLPELTISPFCQAWARVSYPGSN